MRRPSEAHHAVAALLGSHLAAECVSAPTAPAASGTPPDAGTAGLVTGPPPALRLPTDVRPAFVAQIIRSETRPGAWPVLRDRAASLAPRMRDDRAERMSASIGAAWDRSIADEGRRTLGPVMDRLDGGPVAFQQALGRIERCAAIRDRTQPDIEAWLAARGRARAGVAAR